MKKILAIVALCAPLCLLGGCDYVRQLAGRPTSQDIEAKRQRLEQEALVIRQREDSLRRVREMEQARQRREADSLATLEELRGSGVKLVSSKRVVSARAELPSRYYVIVGAFSVPEFATRQAGRADKAGYPATKIPFRNGLTAVGVSPSDNLVEVFTAWKKLRSEDFCPAEAWILEKE